MADIYSIPIFEGETILAGASATSQAFPLNRYKPLGNFASQLLVAGDSAVTVTMYVSQNNGESYVASSFSPMWSAKTVGEYTINNLSEVATHFYIVVAASGGTSADVSLWLAIQ